MGVGKESKIMGPRLETVQLVGVCGRIVCGIMKEDLEHRLYIEYNILTKIAMTASSGVHEVVLVFASIRLR
jgi:hypothetical protein